MPIWLILLTVYLVAFAQVLLLALSEGHGWRYSLAFAAGWPLVLGTLLVIGLRKSWRRWS